MISKTQIKIRVWGGCPASEGEGEAHRQRLSREERKKSNSHLSMLGFLVTLVQENLSPLVIRHDPVRPLSEIKFSKEKLQQGTIRPESAGQGDYGVGHLRLPDVSILPLDCAQLREDGS